MRTSARKHEDSISFPENIWRWALSPMESSSSREEGPNLSPACCSVIKPKELNKLLA